VIENNMDSFQGSWDAHEEVVACNLDKRRQGDGVIFVGVRVVIVVQCTRFYSPHLVLHLGPDLDSLRHLV